MLRQGDRANGSREARTDSRTARRRTGAPTMDTPPTQLDRKPPPQGGEVGAWAFLNHDLRRNFPERFGLVFGPGGCQRENGEGAIGGELARR